MCHWARKRDVSLIIAAPDLLAALEAFAYGHHVCSAAICTTQDEALAAIAKAKGGDDAK